MPFLRRASRWIDRRDTFLMLALFLVAFHFRVVIVPHELIEWEDEYVHVNVVSSVFLHNRCEQCVVGSPSGCTDFDLCRYPPGMSVLGTVYSWLFGFSVEGLLTLSAILGSFSVPMLYLLARAVGGDRNSAVLSGLFLTVLPLHVKYSTSWAAGAIYMFTVLLASLAFLAWEDHRRPSSLAFLMATFGLVAYVKPEGLMALVPFAAVTLWRGRLPVRSGERWPVAGFVLLCSPLVVKSIMTYGQWPGLGITYFRTNIVPYIGFWLHAGWGLGPTWARCPVWISLPAVVGLALVLRDRKQRERIAPFLIWLALFFVFYAFVGTSVHARHTLTYSHVICLLAGLGAGSMAARVGSDARRRLVGIVLAATVFGFGVNAIWTGGLMEPIETKDGLWRELGTARGRLEPSCFFVSDVPYVPISFLGHEAIDTQIVGFDENVFTSRYRSQGCAYYLHMKNEGFYAELDMRIRSSYSLKPVFTGRAFTVHAMTLRPSGGMPPG
ncbi:MAG: glycosyltransferase family 39 protein [Candidatus Undinarchaeales archaeon]|nr:glycosyltransferase family 39 protein [Candidatus Undinarchaeales archaeon]MDP7493282.1 glycosyltransferase family 39 protein [Candidatus Undinarchaeales archaeon]